MNIPSPVLTTSRLLLYALCAVLPGLAVSPPTFAAPARADAAPTTVSHTFTFAPADGGADVKTVSVAGTFNNWDKNALPMTKSSDGVTWLVTTTLPFGRQQYKFVVNGDKWLPDPHAQKSEDDGGGNLNSVLTILPPDYDRPASGDDGVIAVSALLHDQLPPSLNYDRGQLMLSLRARPGDARSIIALVNGKTFPLQKQSADELYARYVTRVPWDRRRDLSYRFDLMDGPTTFHYGANGLTSGVDVAKPFTLKAAEYKPFLVPGWVEQTVFYQIFPDRFENGDKTNDPKDVQPWDAKPQWFNWFGGDIAGVEKHAAYLSSLGVNAVYFNPVFQSPSNHRYDASDYKRIDPRFGTNDEFVRMTNGLQKRGIRTVMDFVFNHSATSFFAFQDIQDKGAASVYKDWYFIQSYPVRISDKPNYTAWFGFSSMPKFNVMNPPTHDYLLSVVDYWKTKVPLSGIRLDVANEVDPRFWRDLRVKAKSLDPNLWIVGEVWGDGSPWLKGDEWDSVMNYQFRDACVRFFAEEKTTPTQFLNRLTTLNASYAPQVSRNMMNMLSSHDTPRFLTLCKGNAQMDRLAATLQFTWVGAPSIYYGEELGMEGGPDPDNRRGMEWRKETPGNAILQHYKKLIALRKANPALQSGDATMLMTDDAHGTLAFARTLGKDFALVAVNRSREPRTVTIPLGAISDAARTRLRSGKGLADALTGTRTTVGADDTLTVTLAPLTGAVLVP